MLKAILILPAFLLFTKALANPNPEPPLPVATFDDVENAVKNHDALIIDVRQPEEVKLGSIPTSINIPLNDVETALKDLSPEEFKKKYGVEKPAKDYPIIFTCREGNRSNEGQKIAVKLGFTKTKNYVGGWEEYSEKIKEKKH